MVVEYRGSEIHLAAVGTSEITLPSLCCYLLCSSLLPS